MKILILGLIIIACVRANGQIIPRAYDYWIIRNPDGILGDFREPSNFSSNYYGWKLQYGQLCGIEWIGMYRWIGQIGDSVLVRYEKDQSLKDSMIYKVRYYECACGFGTLFFIKKSDWDERLDESRHLRAKLSQEEYLRRMAEREKRERIYQEKKLILNILKEANAKTP